jgi:hypothetical protein
MINYSVLGCLNIRREHMRCMQYKWHGYYFKMAKILLSKQKSENFLVYICDGIENISLMCQLATSQSQMLSRKGWLVWIKTSCAFVGGSSNYCKISLNCTVENLRRSCKVVRRIRTLDLWVTSALRDFALANCATTHSRLNCTVNCLIMSWPVILVSVACWPIPP